MIELEVFITLFAVFFPLGYLARIVAEKYPKKPKKAQENDVQ